MLIAVFAVAGGVAGVVASRGAGEGAEAQAAPPVPVSASALPSQVAFDPTTHDSEGLPKLGPPIGWKYASRPDEIRGGDIKFATLASENEIATLADLNMHLVLQFARAPGEATGLSLYLDGGSFACESRLCTFPASIDGKRETILFRAEPERGMMFALGGEQLAQRLYRAERLVIEVGVADRGTEQFGFDLAGLQWEF